jgi:choline dehydrogenase
VRVHADTVIVGAGSAGAVIAARATENPRLDVLLVEAGPDYPPDVELPADLQDGTRNSMSRHDWGFWHRPVAKQKVPFAMPRGRVVGGSSAVNTCIALRGQPYDYDEWAELGLPDWSWAKCLPAFKRLESDLDFANEWHSQDGPIPIRRHKPTELTPWNAGFMEACASAAFTPCADSNDPTTTGYGPHAMNKVHGERMSAARCYLTREVRSREGLRILPDTLVRRVLLDDRRRVTGLEVETLGRVHEIGARRVILCGGALATPSILIRSGIGPRDQVERLGVTLVRDVPGVGSRLLDHPGCAIFLRPVKDGVCDTSNPIIQTVLRVASEGSARPNDIQVQPGSFVPLPHFNLPWFVTMSVCVGKPKGHGQFRLESASPRARPHLDSRFLDDPRDRKQAVDAILLGYRLTQEPSMRALARPFWPSAKVLDDRAALGEFIWRITGSGYHPCGTVPMGADDDPAAATDGHGRVRGVEGLHVADASLMPTIPSSNTNLPTLMMGERFGEWVREGTL